MLLFVFVRERINDTQKDPLGARGCEWVLKHASLRLHAYTRACVRDACRVHARICMYTSVRAACVRTRERKSERQKQRYKILRKLFARVVIYCGGSISK